MQSKYTSWCCDARAKSLQKLRQCEKALRKEQGQINILHYMQHDIIGFIEGLQVF